MTKTESITTEWIRNRSDERAVENGCRFDIERATYAVWWIERYCRLYEGASGPMRLVGCHQCGDYGLPDLAEDSEWDDWSRGVAEDRAHRFSECVKAGHSIDWQYDCTMRLYGWVKWSEKWDRWVRRFRESSIWVAKKNKKSPTLAAHSLYTLCGDGEDGQKVYLAAKDGRQVREIAVGHVLEMVRQSDELADECQINLNLSSVTHRPTKSRLIPLSSANERTQKSKEGLNGSVFIDETHVVDRAFVSRINRAGISRAEPLHAEYSTAGDDPASYGRERFDFACKVISGDVENQGLFAAVYAAPQDVTDDEIAADPLKYGRMANPAMGHTVDPEEFLDDYRRSQSSVEAMGKFKMYRLNIWLSSSSPFLKPSDWSKCGRDFSEEEMKGRTCYAGLDLALKWDTTAFVLVFPWEEEGRDECYRVLPHFFLPRDRAHAMRDKVAWFDWEKRGFITATDGDVTDYRQVRSKINELCQSFDVQGINYDKRFAESFCQTLQDEDGLPVVEFAQSVANFNEPLFTLERLVIAGGMHHNNNAVLNWQAGNLTHKNGLPKKPDAENHRKIDGMVALIMGLAGCLKGDGEAEVCNMFDIPGSVSL